MYSGKIAVPPGGGGKVKVIICISFLLQLLLPFLSNAKIRLVLRQFFGAVYYLVLK
jgi:hypothetical protein